VDKESADLPSGEEPARVWRRRRPINYPKQIEVSGGIAAPLLAGFSLTAVAELAIGSNHLKMYQWAIALFAVASVLFIYALQLSAIALGLSATPAERLDYSPEAASVPVVLRAVRLRQWEETARRVKYTWRAGICYDAGIVSFLGGLGFIIVPHTWRPWPMGNFIGLIVVGVAFVIEIQWASSRATHPEWLLPKVIDISLETLPDDVRPDSLPDDGRDILFQTSIADELDKLARLREREILTEEEFIGQKTRLLS